MPRNTRRDAVGLLDDFIDTAVDGLLTVAEVARAHPADPEVQETLQDSLDALEHLVVLRNGLQAAAS